VNGGEEEKKGGDRGRKSEKTATTHKEKIVRDRSSEKTSKNDSSPGVGGMVSKVKSKSSKDLRKRKKRVSKRELSGTKWVVVSSLGGVYVSSYLIFFSCRNITWIKHSR